MSESAAAQSASGSVGQYLVQKHVFLCLSAGYVVLLDLRKDRYFALGMEAAEKLRPWVMGWPVGSDGAGAEHAPLNRIESDVLRKMLERNLLTTESSVGKDAMPVQVCAPDMEITVDTYDGNLRVGMRDALAVLAASTRSAVRFRCQSIERVVGTAAKCKASSTQISANFDVVELRRLIAIFGRVSPFVFTAKDACLFESLALFDYLVRHGCFPTWIFGVRGAPFAAHCWLQLDKIVLNDSLDHVRGFTPIMAI